MADSDRTRHDSHQPNPSKTSDRALDSLNVFLADVRDGMGPFLGTFLREKHHWDAGRVGIALAAVTDRNGAGSDPLRCPDRSHSVEATGGRDRGDRGRRGLRRDLPGADTSGGGRRTSGDRGGGGDLSTCGGGPDARPGRAGGDGAAHGSERGIQPRRQRRRGGPRSGAPPICSATGHCSSSSPPWRPPAPSPSS